MYARARLVSAPLNSIYIELDVNCGSPITIGVWKGNYRTLSELTSKSCCIWFRIVRIPISCSPFSNYTFRTPKKHNFILYISTIISLRYSLRVTEPPPPCEGNGERKRLWNPPRFLLGRGRGGVQLVLGYSGTTCAVIGWFSGPHSKVRSRLTSWCAFLLDSISKKITSILLTSLSRSVL